MFFKKYWKKSVLYPLFISLSLFVFAFVLDKAQGYVRISDLSSITTSLNSINSFDPANVQNYKGLPVAKIKSYTTPKPLGTVIFLPQYHKYPGSNAQDKVNDSAQKAQEEIYHILNFLTKKGNINLIMAEGEIFGKTSSLKTAKLADKIEKRNAFETECKKLEESLKNNKLDPSLEKSLFDNMHKELAKIDREIILAGSEFKLAAEDKNVVIVGSENEETRQKSAILVRDYIYLKDRVKQIENPQETKQASIFSNSSFTVDDLERLQNFFSSNSLKSTFRSLESLADLQGNKELSELIQKVEKSFYNLKEEDQSKIELTNSLSREENPYQDTNNLKTLKGKIAQDEEKIEELVVKQRNKETAQNFAKALKEKHLSIGILQFGAGHEEGLVKELNNEGLSVVVVTSNEVADRNSKLDS